MTFGDADNDAEMTKLLKELQWKMVFHVAVATAITDTNDNDGVAVEER